MVRSRPLSASSLATPDARKHRRQYRRRYRWASQSCRAPSALAGSFNGLAGLSFSRYGVQLCSHGSYSLMFFWMRRDTGTHNAPCGSTLPGVHHISRALSWLRRRTRCLHAARHGLGGASTSLKALVGAVYNRRYDADDYSGHAPGSSPRSRHVPTARRRLLPGCRRAP